MHKSAIDKVRLLPECSYLKCLIFQKTPKIVKTLIENDYSYDDLKKTIKPCTIYEPIDSNDPSYLFTSYVFENSIPELKDVNELQVTDLYLSRPTAGYGVAMTHSLKKHLGVVDPNDCMSFTGSLYSSAGIGYNIVGPLLLGSHALIIEHPISDFLTLNECLTRSKTTTLLIDTITLRE